MQKISQGTLDTILVHPREVFRTAIAAGASAIVLAHNHPSGDPAPSEADIRVTRDLIRAGQILKIEVLDHVILGRRSLERARDYVSLRELGCFVRPPISDPLSRNHAVRALFRPHPFPLPRERGEASSAVERVTCNEAMPRQRGLLLGGRGPG